MDREHQAAHGPAQETDQAGEGAESLALGLVLGAGRIPGVSDTGEDGDVGERGRQLSASELAFGARDDAEVEAKAHPVDELGAGETEHEHDDHATRTLASASSTSTANAASFHYTGEPLPYLKEIVQGKHGGPKRNLAVFLAMVRQAKVRPGTGGARTFTSPADGLAAIITGVILMIVEKYRGVATAKQGRVLDRVLNDHIVLLAKPMSRDGRSGGHRIGGFKRQGDGLVGPALSHGASVRVETVNQTAVVLLGLQRLVENPRFVRKHARIHRLIDNLTPEFKASVAHCYKGRDVHDWHYGASARLEDESHLKTSWDMIMKLGKTDAKAAAWYRAEAKRIERLWPRVTGSWDGLSNAAGSLP